MMRLVIIGTRKTGTSLALVSTALKRGMPVTIISNPEDRLEEVFPPEVEINICLLMSALFPGGLEKNTSGRKLT